MVDEDEDEDDAKRAFNNSRSLNYLKQQLPVSWSHNPLTTLKLMICNLYAGKRLYLLVNILYGLLLLPPEEAAAEKVLGALEKVLQSSRHV
ncbi:PREDICTED: PRUPE_5G035900 [Prunus dulcis]|uniref:PREDICTED: PRUPE_5G035900 n=1 Tax=Prunus dulcis TaxID=3755 RepID=A0A5E4FXW0_PRUDU|nr:PREDICTED: PRUPE_5G035900 [Prunus dulcis]